MGLIYDLISSSIFHSCFCQQVFPSVFCKPDIVQSQGVEEGREITGAIGLILACVVEITACPHIPSCLGVES